MRILISIIAILASISVSAQTGLVFGSNFVPAKHFGKKGMPHNYTFIGIGHRFNGVQLSLTYTIDMNMVSIGAFVPIKKRKKFYALR